MNENAPQPESTEPSFVDLVEQPSTTPLTEEQKDAKYMVLTPNLETNLSIMKSRVEKSIDDLFLILKNPHIQTAENEIERIVDHIANDLGSLMTLQQKNGEKEATVAGLVPAFEKLNDPLLQPLRAALLSYKNSDYGAPLDAVKVLTEQHKALVNRTKAERSGV